MHSFSHEGNYYGGGQYIVENLDFQYLEIETFRCKLCEEGINQYVGVKKDGLWGYVSVYIDAEEHIYPKYISISSMAKGFALVEYEKRKFGYIDSYANFKHLNYKSS